ncbi:MULTISPECIES: SlyX family protein [unclassified Acinetobacter]|uniref:SlyX family protein n=1 Tax=unclassified Acinetobacter TaxID=196816 RepID=UPI0035BB095D
MQQVLADLQMRITFLDDLVEQLNNQVAEQNQQIVDLQHQMQVLYHRVEQADLSDGIAPFDPISNIPPHF